MAAQAGSSCIPFHAASGKVLLQHRTDDAPVNPGRWAMFGGASEPADQGDPVTTACRELREELGIDVPPDLPILLWTYITVRGVRRHVYLVPWPTVADDFTLSEGQGYGWFTLDEALTTLDLTASARHDLTNLKAQLASDAGQRTTIQP